MTYNEMVEFAEQMYYELNQALELDAEYYYDGMVQSDEELTEIQLMSKMAEDIGSWLFD